MIYVGYQMGGVYGCQMLLNSNKKPDLLPDLDPQLPGTQPEKPMGQRESQRRKGKVFFVLSPEGVAGLCRSAIQRESKRPKGKVFFVLSV